MISAQPKLVFGAAGLCTEYGFDTPHQVQSFLDTVAELGIDTIDTSRIYGNSEELLGRAT